MGEAGAFSMYQPKFALELKLANRNMHQFSRGQFSLDADLGYQCNSISHGYENLNGLDRRQLYAHVQRSLMALECLNDFCKVGRCDVLGYNQLDSQLLDFH